MDEKWTALAREAALGAEHLGIGATAIGKANYAQVAYYHQAFFALSVGMERSSKLALALAGLLESDAFPSSAKLKSYGHDLRRLISDVEAAAFQHGAATGGSGACRAPSEPVHTSILNTLTDFSRNVTRYYNLESLTETSGTDPVLRWYTDVIKPVLEERYHARYRKARERKADVVSAMMSRHTVVHAHLEDGTLVTDFADLVRHRAAVDFAAPWVRMNVLHFARFLGECVSALGGACQGRGYNVPDFSEFYRIYLAPDRAFRSNVTWSIHT